MSRYDVYENSNGAGYLLDVQTDLLNALNTKVVVPLLPVADAPKAAKRLNPIFEIKGQKHVMVTQFMAAVPVGVLKIPATNLSDRFDEITNALDIIFLGF